MNLPNRNSHTSSLRIYTKSAYSACLLTLTSIQSIYQNTISVFSSRNFNEKKMKVLKLNEKTLEWMGIRLHSATGHSNDLWKSVNTYFVLLNIIMVIGTSATYMYKNHSSVNIQDLIFAVMQIVAVLGNLGAFLSLAFNQKSIKHLHGKLQQIVDGGKIKRDVMHV